LKVSTITVIRQWNFARAWLLRELAGTTKDDAGIPGTD
jgi:hypothetical protein